ncbi:MAG: SulP family inorganic anion transporter [Nannocystaceae bacterium]
MQKNRFKEYGAYLKEDLSGALLAAIIGLPMGLAFGVQSGLGPQAGIYTGIFLAIFASIFGGTKTLISDPTGPMTVVGATVVSMALAQNGGALDGGAWTLIVATFVLAGVFELIFGVLDLGRFVKYLPYPVLSGFMAGIGVIIISVQLYPLLGHPSPPSFLGIITHFDDPVTHIHWDAFLLGLTTMALIYGLPLISKRIPAILVALVGCSVGAHYLHLDVATIGMIPHELPKAHIAEFANLKWSDLDLIITPAIMLAGLGVIDTLLTSVVADNLTRTKHNTRWTVIGQGLGNLVCGIFGGIPGAGATMGTVTNIRSGARTKVSGVMKGVFLLIIVAGIYEYVQYIPNAVLAGILITIGIGIVDYRGVKMLFRVPRADAAIWAIVLLVTLFDNLLDAVAVGFVLASVLFIVKMASALDEHHDVKALCDFDPESALPQDLASHIYVQTLDGPVFFGFADQFREHCRQITDVKAVIVRMMRVPFLDQSGLVTLEDVMKDWRARGIDIYITGANALVKQSLERVKIVPRLVDAEHEYDEFSACLGYIRNKYAPTPSAGAGVVEAPRGSIAPAELSVAVAP